MRLIWLLLLGLPSPATAQVVDCYTATTQSEMNLCAMHDWEAADLGLNAAYRRAVYIMKGLDAGLPKDQRGAEAALRRAQRAWVTVRDDTCTAQGYAMHGGSAEPLLIYGCRADMTRNRARELMQLVME